jgi:hypothetical protein
VKSSDFTLAIVKEKWGEYLEMCGEDSAHHLNSILAGELSKAMTKIEYLNKRLERMERKNESTHNS